MNRDKIEQFNTSGRSGRDCPLCFRVGALDGPHGKAAIMECLGCGTRFSLDRGDSTRPDTLTRIRTPDPIRELTPEEQDRVRGGVA